MKIHPREQLIKEIEMKLKTAIVEATRELTTAETIQLVNHVCRDEIAGIVKYQIRMERHGNTNTPGGMAPDAPHVRSCEHCGADRVTAVDKNLPRCLCGKYSVIPLKRR
jgi:hypothetical protein